jgi:predicted TIM-barrel fold metal-dependent hydrolase
VGRRASSSIRSRSAEHDRIRPGSDWPHTQFEKLEDYDRAYRLMQTLLPDERERHAVLADTPAALFGFA